MVVEYIRYTVPSARAEEFEDAYQRAGRVLDADPHCVRWEVARGAQRIRGLKRVTALMATPAATTLADMHPRGVSIYFR